MMTGLWKGHLTFENLKDVILPEYLVLEILSLESRGVVKAVLYSEEQPIDLKNLEKPHCEKTELLGTWGKDFSSSKENRFRLVLNGTENPDKEVELILVNDGFSKLNGTFCYRKRPGLKAELHFEKDKFWDA